MPIPSGSAPGGPAGLTVAMTGPAALPGGCGTGTGTGRSAGHRANKVAARRHAATDDGP
ncbi:MAG: hypothetical protein AVDCRST_MAG49-141 [uncultured Thermomicrobiales bacterium]|uniref:Uncharacterized protein n=1 Tax=uncultured Thermomicrobiales bacterium TaxID=1645740 RepID=A0A6J4TWU7_9BACT|nr:MAG: hypothetical protein AVDCRST_MAG49-141 [uncultured Thermomicrobiales bacterium]